MDCGPSNAVKNLTQYTQRDTSIQNDIVRGNPLQQQNFRNTGVDVNLNNQFNEFGSHPDFQFQGQFQGQKFGGQGFGQAQFQGPAQQHQQQHQQQQQQHQWMNDFSQMSLQQAHQIPQAHQAPQAPQAHQSHQHQHHTPAQDWHHQFLHQNRVAMPFHLNTRSSLNTHYEPQTNQMSEHQQIHKLEQEHDQFEQEFQLLEKELTPSHDKEQFAKTAAKIHQSLNDHSKNDMKQKLQESNFMKLMNSISNREVELSEEGDKLVDSQGNDISREDSYSPYTESHSHRDIHSDGLGLSDASRTQSPAPVPAGASLAHTASQHGPSSVQNGNNSSHLPDPLAHIPDGALNNINGPLEAARVISGNQVKSSNWLEDDFYSMTDDGMNPISNLHQMRQAEFDAYRHDDDYN